MTARRALPPLVAAGAVALGALAGAARADEPASAPGDGARTEVRSTSSATVRATHRVDVIAPGERVETVIGRLRASRPPVAAQVPGGAAAATGAGGRERDGERRPGGDVDRATDGDDGRSRSTEGSHPSHPGGDRNDGHSSPGHLRP